MTETLEGPERDDAAGAGVHFNVLAKGAGDGGVSAFDEEALSGFAAPGIGVSESGGEFGGCGCEEIGRGGRGVVLGDQTVDTAHAEGFFESAFFDLVAKESGDEDAVLENAAIHIDNVEGAVGAVIEVDGTKAFVG